MALFISTKSSCSFINRTSVKIWGNYNLEQWLDMWLPDIVGQKEQELFFFLAKVSSVPHLNHPFAFSSQVSLCWTPVLCRVCPALLGAVGALQWMICALGCW